jgi:hypothetical protein
MCGIIVHVQKVESAQATSTTDNLDASSDFAVQPLQGLVARRGWLLCRPRCRKIKSPRFDQRLLSPSGPSACSHRTVTVSDFALKFWGFVLHLRGEQATVQPVQDSQGNVLLFNGEIFDGLEVRFCDSSRATHQSMPHFHESLHSNRYPRTRAIPGRCQLPLHKPAAWIKRSP